MSGLLPKSIGIAGAGGYIGGLTFEAAQALAIETHVFDPAIGPANPKYAGAKVWTDEAGFYQCPDLRFHHLALHPQHRETGMGYLLERARIEPMLVLCEKPMAPPQDPRMCPRIVQAVSATQAVWMYNFLELYDPMTHAIIEWLRQSGEVKIHTIETYRGKEREDPDNPRNYKPIVSIEYQEAIHDMAFLLYLFGALAGNLQRALRGRVLVRTLERQPYNPPNKNEYSREVNGSCKYHMLIGSTDIEGQVSFKEGAPKAKWKVLRGIADGQPFVIRTSTQEDNKWLKINGTYRDFAVSASTYEATIQTLWSWYEGVPHKELMMAGAIYPNPVFAWAAYQLSGALWCSGWRNATVEFGSFGKLLGFDAGFPEGSISLPFYRKQ